MDHTRIWTDSMGVICWFRSSHRVIAVLFTDHFIDGLCTISCPGEEDLRSVQESLIMIMKWRQIDVQIVVIIFVCNGFRLIKPGLILHPQPAVHFFFTFLSFFLPLFDPFIWKDKVIMNRERLSRRFSAIDTTLWTPD